MTDLRARNLRVYPTLSALNRRNFINWVALTINKQPNGLGLTWNQAVKVGMALADEAIASEKELDRRIEELAQQGEEGF